MSDFSSPIDCVTRKNLTINKDCEMFLQDVRLDSFDAIWGHAGGETIKNIRPRSVTRFEVTHNSRKKILYLKRHNLEFVGLGRLFPRFFPTKCHSQGLLEFNNICEFRNRGMRTVVPVMAGEKFSGCCRAESFLVTEDCYPYISLENLLKNKPGFFKGQEGQNRKKILIHEISALARKMHQNGLNHQDFNATHILLNYEKGSDVPELALFDMQRVEKNKIFRLRWKIKSLARLNYTLPDELFTPQDRINLLRFYKKKEHLNFLDRLEWFWILKKTDRIRRHTEKKGNQCFDGTGKTPF